MRTWIGIFLIATVLVVLALRGVFGIYPDEWEWVGIVLAAAGIAMAAPGMFQLIFGRAKLVLEPDTHPQEANRSLVVFMKNQPVSRFLRNLGVKRDTIQSLTAHFQIKEAGSGQILVPIRHARFYSDSDESDGGRGRIPLPPTYSVGSSLLVALWDPASSQALVVPDRLRQAQPLPPGYFEAEFIFVVDGEPTKYRGRFVVGPSADDLTWSPKTLERVT